MVTKSIEELLGGGGDGVAKTRRTSMLLGNETKMAISCERAHALRVETRERAREGLRRRIFDTAGNEGPQVALEAFFEKLKKLADAPSERKELGFKLFKRALHRLHISFPRDEELKLMEYMDINGNKQISINEMAFFLDPKGVELREWFTADIRQKIAMANAREQAVVAQREAYAREARERRKAIIDIRIAAAKSGPAVIAVDTQGKEHLRKLLTCHDLAWHDDLSPSKALNNKPAKLAPLKGRSFHGVLQLEVDSPYCLCNQRISEPAPATKAERRRRVRWADASEKPRRPRTLLHATKSSLAKRNQPVRSFLHRPYVRVLQEPGVHSLPLL